MSISAQPIPRSSQSWSLPVRACIFDVDGLLIDTEDCIPIANNAVLASYGRSPMPKSLHPRLQGRPPMDAIEIVLAETKLSISPQEFRSRQVEKLLVLFKHTQPLPGVLSLLTRLSRATVDGAQIQLAIATSSPTTMYQAKSEHLPTVFDLIPEKHKIMGDDPWIQVGRGKPHPDIFLLALERINNSLCSSSSIRPEECLVFEDSVAGVTAATRAGMRCIWVPHPDVRALYFDDSGKSQNDCPVSVSQGSGVEIIPSLVDFDYARYGIVPT